MVFRATVQGLRKALVLLITTSGGAIVYKLKNRKDLRFPGTNWPCFQEEINKRKEKQDLAAVLGMLAGIRVGFGQQPSW